MISRTKLHPATERGVDCPDTWETRIHNYNTAINKTVKTEPPKAVLSTNNCLTGKDEIKNANKKLNSSDGNSHNLENKVVEEPI